MYIQCVVCGNCNTNTKLTRPEVIYHQFPNNQYSRKKWLKVCRLDHLYKFQRVCSDHFLKEQYSRQGNKRLLFKSAIPQPYVRSGNGNGFLYNSTTQSNGMQVDDNTFLPIEQNRLREEQYVENDVNNLAPPKPSSKQIERQIPADQFIANDNIQTVVKSVVEPVITTTQDWEPDCPIPGRKTNTDGDIEENGFIFEISKTVELPSPFWKSDNVKERNKP
ncbi:unnamed protein product [Macrosiphum euphorbiae]|uniref:THAP-type domain-containing protein n=1 Tax=Macrosiphum euphorbiae TaxID=13131 RepID=A0AAV0WRB0_9HEMI|nr:unnamed protein product [Macrosiphum euphorbiae]